MPRMTQLAEAEVVAAIRDLVEHGEYPTSARLRERLEAARSEVGLSQGVLDLAKAELEQARHRFEAFPQTAFLTA